MDEFEQERSRSSKIGQIIGIIVCFILIVGLAYGLIFLSHQLRLINADIESVEKDIKNTQDSIEMKQAEINTIKTQLDENINIDELIIEQKEKFQELEKRFEQSIVVDDLDQKIAYLTFVDGPYKLTNKFLDVLDEYDVKATFFCLEKDENYDYDEETTEIYNEIYKRIIESGHTLANGTSLKITEEELTINDTDEYIDEIINNKNFINDNYNYETNIMRLVDNEESSDEAKEELLNRLNKEKYGYIEYNCNSYDNESLVNVDQLISNVVDNTNDRKILVVEMHDYNANTLEALPYIIEGLKEKGYTLLPLFYDSVMVKK